MDRAETEGELAQSASEEAAHERLLRRGAAALTDPELLSVLLGYQEPSRVPLEGRLRPLLMLEPPELCELPGLGPSRAGKLLAAVELGRRALSCPEERPRLARPEEVFRYLLPTLGGLRREEFHVLCLNPHNRLLRDAKAAEGSADSCYVDPREIFAPALAARASAVVLAHNHPSGDPTPSPHDLMLTTRMVRAGEILGVRVIDHIVVGDGRYTSMAERGQMPKALSEGELPTRALDRLTPTGET